VRLARFEIDGRVATGVVEGDAVVSLEPLFGPAEQSRSLDALVRTADSALPAIDAFLVGATPTAKLDRVRLLAPLTEPRKIVAIGSNFPRPGGQDMGAGSLPVLFFKPPSSLCGPGDPIVLPPEADLVIGEVELALVIGRCGDRISAADAMDHVFGVMVANDVTAPGILLGASDRNPLFLQQSRGKGFRSFCPIGPWIETVADSEMVLEQRIDDFVEIRGEAAGMITDIQTLLVDVSAAFGLEAGDIVLTGSPPPLSGKRTPLTPGVTLHSSISGIGTLSNPVVGF